MGISLRLILGSLAGLLLGWVAISPPPLDAGSPSRLNTDQSPLPYLVAGKASPPPNRVLRSHKPPTLVRNVRMKAYPEYTRVVLDLQRTVTYSQIRKKNPDRVIIELKNAALGKAALAKLADKDFPSEITVFQPRPGAVRVSLDLERLSKYKLLPLNNPPRLVVDIFHNNGVNGSAPSLGGSPGPNGQSPGQPVKPRVLGRQIKTIVIDPGHGGRDPGAVGRRGTREKDITLKIGLYLRTLITKRLGKKVVMTRDRDVFVELEGRADTANKHDADLFVSIHVNSHPKRRIKGIEIYHFGEASDRRALEVAARENGTPIEATGVGVGYLVADLLTTKKVDDSLEFAWTAKKKMVGHIRGKYKVVDHGVKTAPFYVLRFTTMPSILAEIGFVSNATEERQMRTKAYRRRVGEAIFEGIKAYVKSVEAPRLTAHP